MEQKKLWKRLLSVILSVSMVVGLITVSGPNRAEAADASTLTENLVENGSFDGDGTYDSTGWENISEAEKIALTKKYELVENGDFEAGNSKSGDNGWETQTGNKATLSVVDDSGNKALQVVASGPSAQADFYVGKAGFLEIGRTYTVSFDIKRTSGTDGLTLYTVNVIDSWETHGWKELSNKWTTITMQITPQMDQAWAQIGFQLESACTVLVDNFSISYTDVDTVTTKTEVVKNGDFETGITSSDNSGWYKNNPVSLQVANEVGNENNKVLELTSTGGGIAYFQVFTPTYEVDKTYTVSYRVRTTGGNIGFTNYSELIVSGWNSHGWKQATTTWQTVSYEITPAQSKAWANIGIQFDGSTGDNKLYIDDFSVSTTETKTKYKNTDGLLVEDGDYALFMSTITSAMNTATGSKLTEGTTYDYSFYVKNKETDSDFTLDFCADSMKKPVLSGAHEASDTWTLVTGSFEVPEGGVEKIGFERSGTGDVYIDDLVISVSKIAPTDHTSVEGAYIPEGQMAVFSQDMTTSSNLNLGSHSGAAVEEGMLKLPYVAQNQYVQTNPITVTGGTTYTLSFYVWVVGAENGFEFNIFASGGGNPYKDKATTSITGDTDGWKLLTYEFTATSDTTIIFGLQNYGTGAGTVYLDDLALSTEAVGVAEDIELTYKHGSSNFHYEQEYRLYIKSTGTARENLTGTLKINGTEVSMKYEHHNGGLVLLFNGKLSETDVNTVVIPAGTTLYNGNVAVYNIVNTFTIYTQKVADGQWMTWLSEYDYQGSDVLYYDMGTVDTKYVFNNVTGITYQGVLKVTGKADIILGGTESGSQEVTDLGDYKVSRTIQGEKYDYTVALYKRGDADKTQDGKLTAKDLVASKKAVNAAPAEFGHARYKAADSNTDGKVNEEDAAFMRYILVNDEYDITTTTSKGYSTLGQGVMPIVGYGGPDDHGSSKNTDLVKRSSLSPDYQDDFLEGEIADKIFGLVQELGINVFTNQVNEVGTDYVTSTKMLKLAQKYNLGVYINNAYISGAGTVETELVPQTAKYDMFSSFHGYYVADEPSDKDAIKSYTKQLDALKNRVNIASYFNMSPLGDSSFSENASKYKDYLQEALKTGAESLQYDMYLRGKYQLFVGSEIKTTEFYKNLDIARSLSMNASKPFQAWVQTGANWIDNTTIDRVNNSNRLTVQEMYLEANAALAMGAKGINYFTLLESTTQVENGDNDSGLITVSGEANHNEGGNYDYYNAAKKINTYIAAVDGVLMNATSSGVVTTNSTVKGYIGGAAMNASDEAAGVLKEITGSTEVFVGCFDYYGKDAYLVVNITPDAGGTGSSQSVTLQFDEEVTYSYIRMDGTTGSATGSSLTETVAAGESVLIVMK